MSDRVALQKAAADHLAGAGTSSFLLGLFENLFLPILPGILLQLASRSFAHLCLVALRGAVIIRNRDGFTF